MERLFIAVLVPLAIYLVYYLLKKTRQNEAAIQRVLSDDARHILSSKVRYYQQLSAEDQLVFQQRMLAFLDTITIEGVGVEVSLEDQVFIAASAIIPIFGFKDWRYKNLTNVLLYPDNFNREFQFEGHAERNIMGMVGEGFMNGQMLLSQSALRHGFENFKDGQNTGIHEFVHLLDKSDGATDGRPENLIAHASIVPWLEVMHQEINKIEKGKSDIDSYALTNQAEFLAVASEYFFEKPDQLKQKHPELYRKLSLIFEQDLASQSS